MPMSSSKMSTDKWVSTQATIVACKKALFGQEIVSDVYLPPTYIITFSYEVAGKPYRGSFRVNSPQECGYSFEIRYDPANPKRNTSSDLLDNSWIRWSARILGIGLVIAAIWRYWQEPWFTF